MSQQQFEPQSSGQSAHNEDETYYETWGTPPNPRPAQPYYWSTKPNTEGMPKDEPLSSYGEPEMHSGYQAQDSARNTWNQQAQQQQQQFSPDGDAFEYGYRNYSAPNVRQGPQYWTQQQPRRSSPVGLAFLVLFGLIALSLFFSFVGHFAHGSFFFFIIPLLFLIGLGRMRHRRRYYTWRRGPWPWMW